MEITVNGQTYTRWEDVPPDVRQQLAQSLPDADHNGIPDLLEGKLDGLPTEGTRTFTSTSVTFDGKTVDSIDALPPAMRDAVRRALGEAGGATAATPTAATPTAATPTPPGWTPGTPAPLAPGQVMLNGVPTSVDGTAGAPARKGFWRRLLGR